MSPKKHKTDTTTDTPPEKEVQIVSDCIESDFGEGVTWDQVHGAEAVREATGDFMLKLKHPTLWTGAAIPRACVMLTGPPGTGKTTAVRAVVNQAMNLSTPAKPKVTVFVPVPHILLCPHTVKELFRVAVACAPSIIFIDECETVFSKDSHAVRLATIRIALSDIALKGHMVLMICATNSPLLIEAPIASRMGDFIELPLPARAVRRQIIETMLKKMEVNLCDEDWETVLEKTDGRSGRWLNETLVQEVARIPAREACKQDAQCPRPIVAADFFTVLAATTSVDSPAEPAPSLPAAATAAVGVPNAAADWVVSTYHSIFRPCQPGETHGLSMAIVRDAIQNAEGAPAWLSGLSAAFFLEYFLRPGQGGVPTAARGLCTANETTGTTARQENAISCRRR